MQNLKELPIPDIIAQQHSAELLNVIQSEIKSHGPMRFARYMQLALYAPGLGYYCAGAHKFGAGGDFITAPEISPLFSRCLAAQIQQVFAVMGEASILEVGAGSGLMAADILLALDAHDALPEKYFILELSAELKMRQKMLLIERVPHLIDKIVWLETLADWQMEGVVLANEVLDAMPVHKFKYENELQEFFVDWKNQGLIWHFGSASADLQAQVDQLGIDFSDDYESEINLALSSWVASLSQVLQRGLMLFIDYGYPRHEYYHPDRNMGTLMCHYQHRAHTDPLILTGLQDITAHVDFTAVAEAAVLANLTVAGYTTQANFLLGCGLTEMAATMTADVLQQLEVSQQIKRLILPSEMGELFKVIGLTRNLEIPLLGFSLHNMCEKL